MRLMKQLSPPDRLDVLVRQAQESGAHTTTPDRWGQPHKAAVASNL
jgi:hypothetical protein